MVSIGEGSSSGAVAPGLVSSPDSRAVLAPGPALSLRPLPAPSPTPCREPGSEVSSSCAGLKNASSSAVGYAAPLTSETGVAKDFASSIPIYVSGAGNVSLGLVDSQPMVCLGINLKLPLPALLEAIKDLGRRELKENAVASTGLAHGIVPQNSAASGDQNIIRRTNSAPTVGVVQRETPSLQHTVSAIANALPAVSRASIAPSQIPQRNLQERRLQQSPSTELGGQQPSVGPRNFDWVSQWFSTNRNKRDENAKLEQAREEEDKKCNAHEEEIAVCRTEALVHPPADPFGCTSASFQGGEIPAARRGNKTDRPRPSSVPPLDLTPTRGRSKVTTAASSDEKRQALLGFTEEVSTAAASGTGTMSQDMSRSSSKDSSRGRFAGDLKRKSANASASRLVVRSNSAQRCSESPSSRAGGLGNNRNATRSGVRVGPNRGFRTRVDSKEFDPIRRLLRSSDGNFSPKSRFLKTCRSTEWFDATDSDAKAAECQQGVSSPTADCTDSPAVPLLCQSHSMTKLVAEVDPTSVPPVTEHTSSGHASDMYSVPPTATSPPACDDSEQIMAPSSRLNAPLMVRGNEQQYRSTSRLLPSGSMKNVRPGTRLGIARAEIISSPSVASGSGSPPMPVASCSQPSPSSDNHCIAALEEQLGAELATLGAAQRELREQLEQFCQTRDVAVEPQVFDCGGRESPSMVMESPSPIRLSSAEQLMSDESGPSAASRLMVRSLSAEKLRSRTSTTPPPPRNALRATGNGHSTPSRIGVTGVARQQATLTPMTERSYFAKREMAAPVRGAVKAMQQHASMPDAQSRGCAELLALFECKDGQTAAVEAIDGATASSSSSSQPATVRKHSGSDTARAILEHGGVDAVVSAMEGHRCIESVQRFGSAALRTFLAEADAYVHRKIASHSGVIAALLSAMEEHPADASVQANGCCALQSVAAGSRDAKRVIAQNGGLRTALQSLRIHPSEPLVQERGCMLLCHVASYSHEAGRELVEHGGVEVVLGVMDASLRSEDVQRNCCRLLHSLATGDARARQRIADLDGSQAVLRALEMHPHEKEVRRVGRFFLNEATR